MPFLSSNQKRQNTVHIIMLLPCWSSIIADEETGDCGGKETNEDNEDADYTIRHKSDKTLRWRHKRYVA